ncbi:MAG: hypothetical protein ABI382_14365 [Nakamurella sp.]
MGACGSDKPPCLGQNDALPNLFVEELIKWDLALSVDGLFDHGKISVERILAEIASWRVIPEARASAIIADTLTALGAGRWALGAGLQETSPPPVSSLGVAERLQRNTSRLIAETVIGEPQR